jgi:hypothetical protein
MTHARSWLAPVMLLAAISGGQLLAAEPEKKAEKQSAPACCTKEKACCEGKCCTSDKSCCEGKCCAQTGKSCCADGKCCGCCTKGTQTATLPIAPGSAIQVMIAPPGAFDGPMAQDWACPPLPAQACPVQACPSTPPFALNPQCPYTPICAPAPCVVPPPPPVQGACNTRCAVSPWRLKAVVEKERTCLELQLSGAGEDACVCCEHMVLKIGGESLKVCVHDKQLQVSGSFVQGSADSVTRNTADGSILLEGHVKVRYDKDGQKASVSGERVVVGVADGRLEVKPVEKPQTFTFWLGSFR